MYYYDMCGWKFMAVPFREPMLLPPEYPLPSGFYFKFYLYPLRLTPTVAKMPCLCCATCVGGWNTTHFFSLNFYISNMIIVSPKSTGLANSQWLWYVWCLNKEEQPLSVKERDIDFLDKLETIRGARPARQTSGMLHLCLSSCQEHATE